MRVLDDYAHHPAEIRATIDAVRDGRRVLVLFQPHLYSRTRHLARELGAALASADVVAVTEVYRAREEPVDGVSGKLVVDALRRGAPGMTRRLDAERRAGSALSRRGAHDPATWC